MQMLAQHNQTIHAKLDSFEKAIAIEQTIEYQNTSNLSQSKIILNDWNHAMSSNETPLAKRFSDEFNRNYFLASAKDKSFTTIQEIKATNNESISYKRLENHADLIEIVLPKILEPNEKITFHLSYKIKLPNASFNKFGFYSEQKFALKNWFITPTQIVDNQHLQYSNLDLDETTNASSNYEVTFEIPSDLFLVSNLIESKVENSNSKKYFLNGKNIREISVYIDDKINFYSYKKNGIEILTDLKSIGVNDVYKALVINQMIDFFQENIGFNSHPKLIVSQTDYDKNPFYGLNQLPTFLSPFSNDYIFELKFLKTYLQNFLKTNIQLDYRKDGYLLDGIEVFYTMKYIDWYHSDKKMLGNLNRFWLLKHFHITNVDFNDQFSYFYLLMLRKNLDQPSNTSREQLIKYNEQIAGKYRSGLNFKYLDSYLEKDIVSKTLQQYFAYSSQYWTNRNDFEKLLKLNSKKDIDWFFNTMIDSNEAIDYKLKSVKQNDNKISFELKNKFTSAVPVPVFTIKKDSIIQKKWIEINQQDSVITIDKNEADYVVLNYNNEVPEINQRNNWHNLKNGIGFNKPIAFTLFKDLENPARNQIMYNPSAIYNLYDGISPGIRFHNKTMLDKPFNFDFTPTYSSKTQSLIGNFSLAVNDYNRNSNLFHVKYFVYGTYMHYAPDAAYLKINPTVVFRFRPKDRRSNKSETLMARQVMVFLEPSHYNLSFNNNNEDYSIFNVKYNNNNKEISQHYNFTSELQLSKDFGKTSIDLEYRKMFGSRQLNLRGFAGIFLYNNTSNDYFSFALDRPTDYLFEYNYYGRSESTGIFSQQMILREGAFKSKLQHRFANNWMVTGNASFNIWNWIEAYGDVGFLQNCSYNPAFVYDSGLRLNLVPDYFELYFPVYSSNGWEVGQSNYSERIRFIVTLSPSVLVNLFTRKWF